MKVLLINKFHYMKGGTETFHFALADALQKKGHEVIFFSMADDRNFPCEQSDYFVDNIDYNSDSLTAMQKAKLACKLIYSREAKKKMCRLLEAEKPDIAHISLIHRQLTFSIVDELVAHNVPVVMHLHELSAICPAYTMLRPDGTVCEDCLGGHFLNCAKHKCMKNSRAKSLLACIEALFLRAGHYYDKIDLYIAECDYYRNLALRSDFSKSPIIRMNNFLPEGQTYKAYPAPNGYILYYGRFAREKGVITALKGYKLLGDDAPQFHLVGHGPELERIEAYVSENGLRSKVVLHPATFGEEMDRIIEGARIVVVPSEWYENGAFVVLQALARGKTVVASDIAGLSEIIDEGNTGFLARPGDAKSFALAYGRALALTGAKASDFAENVVAYARRRCDWNSYVDELVGHYEDLIAEKSAVR